MPSGQTHDRITLWSLPVVTALTLAMTRNSDLTLLVAGGFFFSGLMLSPDLDLRSRPFKRWGWLRWIWLPYQKMMRHRSIFSHGMLIGTTLRVLYLVSWVSLLTVVMVAVVQWFGEEPLPWQEFARRVVRSLFSYRVKLIALFIGLELGASSHYLADWSSSAYKRWQKMGVKGWFSGVGKQQVSEKRRGRKNKQMRGRGDAGTRRIEIPREMSFTRKQQKPKPKPSRNSSSRSRKKQPQNKRGNRTKR
ncbi:MAG: metal-binding protein [Symploca sp. SIO2E6]|nr:metal-binding protein [Symploca sp. SIO2E6]